MQELLSPLEYGRDQSVMGFLELGIYRKAGILTQKQCEILERGDQEWATSSAAITNQTALGKWLGKELVHNQRLYQPDNLGGIEFEEADLEFEQLKELEGEHVSEENGKRISACRDRHLYSPRIRFRIAVREWNAHLPRLHRQDGRHQ